MMFSPLSYSDNYTDKIKRLEKIIKKQKNEIRMLKLGHKNTRPKTFSSNNTTSSSSYESGCQCGFVGKIDVMEITYP